MLVLNTTLLVPPDGACAATTAWAGKQLTEAWELDVRLLGESSCSASDVTVAYHQARDAIRGRDTIFEWRAGTCENVDTACSVTCSEGVLTRDDLLSRKGRRNYDTCGSPGVNEACIGYIGQLDAFANDHSASDRFSCEDLGPYTLYAASSCAHSCELSVVVRAVPSNGNFEYCQALNERSAMVLGIIFGCIALIVGGPPLAYFAARRWCPHRIGE